MEKYILLSLFVLLAACGSDDEPTNNQNNANNANNQNNANNAGGSLWSASYTGDLSGEFSGTVTIILAGVGDRTTLVGGSGEANRHEISATIAKPLGEVGETEVPVVTLILEDRTVCRHEGDPLMGTIVSGDKDDYEISFGGDLTCEAGEEIDFTATFIRKK